MALSKVVYQVVFLALALFVSAPRLSHAETLPEPFKWLVESVCKSQPTWSIFGCPELAPRHLADKVTWFRADLPGPPTGFFGGFHSASNTLIERSSGEKAVASTWDWYGRGQPRKNKAGKFDLSTSKWPAIKLENGLDGGDYIQSFSPENVPGCVGKSCAVKITATEVGGAVTPYTGGTAGLYLVNGGGGLAASCPNMDPAVTGRDDAGWVLWRGWDLKDKSWTNIITVATGGYTKECVINEGSYTFTRYMRDSQTFIPVYINGVFASMKGPYDAIITEHYGCYPDPSLCPEYPKGPVVNAADIIKSSNNMEQNIFIADIGRVSWYQYIVGNAMTYPGSDVAARCPEQGHVIVNDYSRPGQPGWLIRDCRVWLNWVLYDAAKNGGHNPSVQFDMVDFNWPTVH